jgi:hypothetical protein
MKNKWLTVAVILIAIGIICYLVNLMVFVPRYVAVQEAMTAWLNSPDQTTPLNPADFGLDPTSMIISSILGYVTGISFLVGGAYVIIQIIAQVAKRRSYTNNPP